MASTLSAIPSSCSIRHNNSNPSSASSSSASSSFLASPLPNRTSRFCTQGYAVVFRSSSPLVKDLTKFTKVRSLAEGVTLIPEQEHTSLSGGSEEEEASTNEQAVSVSVSPSDVLTIFFHAEGTMNDSAIPAVTGALEETEGISNLRVQVLEGIATVELTKQTTLQAAGVASGLIEIIHGSGFKLQTMNLSTKKILARCSCISTQHRRQRMEKLLSKI